MPYFDEYNMSQYSQVNVMAAYVSMIRFAMDKLELHLDELGDDILFDGLSPFPEDVLGDDTLFAGYTDPWSPDDLVECECDECRCGNDKDGNRANRPESKEEYFNWIDSKRMSVGNIMDILNKTRKAPKDYRMD
jgi:hypothetical protein